MSGVSYASSIGDNYAMQSQNRAGKLSLYRPSVRQARSKRTKGLAYIARQDEEMTPEIANIHVGGLDNKMV